MYIHTVVICMQKVYHTSTIHFWGTISGVAGDDTYGACFGDSRITCRHRAILWMSRFVAARLRCGWGSRLRRLHRFAAMIVDSPNAGLQFCYQPLV